MKVDTWKTSWGGFIDFRWIFYYWLFNENLGFSKIQQNLRFSKIIFQPNCLVLEDEERFYANIFVNYSLWKQDCKGLLIIIQYIKFLSNHILRPQPTNLKFFVNHFKNFSKSAGEMTPAVYFGWSIIGESHHLWKHWGNFLRQLLS